MRLIKPIRIMLPRILSLAMIAFLLVTGTITAQAAPSTVSASAAGQCSFMWPSQLQNCSSAVPAVKVESLSEGDTSGCSFGGTVRWGDGSQEDFSFNGAANGTVFDFADHTYKAQGTYPISVSDQVLSGFCTWGDFTVSFTYQPEVNSDLVITSPPGQSVIALTDGKYVQPQAKAGQRAPAARHLIVAGTAKCAGPVTVNTVTAKVSGGKWTADVPAGAAGALIISARAAGCGQTTSTITLISLGITSPRSNQVLPITTVPAMPALNATVDVAGYPDDTSAVSFGWSLTVYGNYVTRKKSGKAVVANWDNPYEERVAAGSTTGTGQPWKPAYAHIAGGIGLLQVKATIPGVLDNPVRSDPRWLEITGNGTSLKSLSEAYTASHMKSAPDAKTMDKIMGCAESNWKQFAQGGAGGAQTVTGVAGAPADMPGLAAAWWPKFGAPAGIGIAQIDPVGGASWPYRDSPYEYGDWDWQANLDSGITLYNQKLAAALRWRVNEQGRLSSRRSALITAAKKNRAGRAGGPFPALVAVPAMTEAQLLQDTIRQYNGGHQYYFDADYVLSPNGLNVLTVGSRTWKNSGTYGGTWGTPARPSQRRAWHLITTKGAAGYVTKVWNCQS